MSKIAILLATLFAAAMIAAPASALPRDKLGIDWDIPRPKFGDKPEPRQEPIFKPRFGGEPSEPSARLPSLPSPRLGPLTAPDSRGNQSPGLGLSLDLKR